MNAKLTELLNIAPEKATKEDNDALIEEIKNSQLIMPIEVLPGKELKFNPVKIVDDNGKLFIPLFSDDSEVHGHTSAIDIYAKDLAEMIDDNPENMCGVVFNPFSKFSVELPMDSFLKIFE